MIVFEMAKTSVESSPGPALDPQGAATTSRGASSDVGNVAEPQLFMGACPTTSARHLEFVS